MLRWFHRRAGLASMHGTICSRSRLIGRRVAFEARAQPGAWLHVEGLPSRLHPSMGRMYSQRIQVLCSYATS